MSTDREKALDELTAQAQELGMGYPKVCPECKGEKIIRKPLYFSGFTTHGCKTCSGKGYIV